MLLYDLSHTSHSQARTGVQRVALALRKALKSGHPIQEVTHDPHLRAWRPLAGWELNSLELPPRSPKRRGSYWPLSAQIAGKLRRALGQASARSQLPESPTGFFTPEIFTARTGRNLSGLFDRISCPKVALFHDSVSLRRPDLTPPGTVGRFPHYLAELLEFDGVMAVSEDSRASLLDYWNWAGWCRQPEVRVLPLGVDHLSGAISSSTSESASDPLPKVLCVGSLEGRKNHLTLLNACERLWQEGEAFELQLIGGLQRETGRPAHDRMQFLQGAGRPIIHQGWVTDEAMVQAYAACAFTVYPSLMEGFGFPIWESLIHGKPCVCADTGAMGEIAEGGGCLGVDTRSASALAEGIRLLLHSPERRGTLARQAQNRTPPQWSEAARTLVDWLDNLSSRS